MAAEDPVGHRGQGNAVIGYYHHYSGFKKRRYCEIVRIGSPFYAATAPFNFRICVSLPLTLPDGVKACVSIAVLGTSVSSSASSGSRTRWPPGDDLSILRSEGITGKLLPMSS